MAFLKQQKAVIGIIIVLVLAVAWYMLSGSSAPAPTLTSTDVSGNAADKNLVSTLLALRAVKLDATIFADPSFLSLRDFSTQIVPEPAGRDDPFAPLKVSPSLSASSTHNAQIFSPRK